MATSIFEAVKNAQRAANKWGELSAQTGAGANQLAPLIALDRARILRGSPPYSSTESMVMLANLMRGQQVVPTPEPGFFANFVRNIREFASGLPRLPGALLEEARTVIADPLAPLRGITQASSLSEAIENVATAPGTRLIPGAYVAAHLAGGTPEELGRNPLFTALDILPGAQKGVKMATRGAMASGINLFGASRAQGPTMRAIARPVTQAVHPMGAFEVQAVEGIAKRVVVPTDKTLDLAPSGLTPDKMALTWAYRNGQVPQSQIVTALRSAGRSEDELVQLFSDPLMEPIALLDDEAARAVMQGVSRETLAEFRSHLLKQGYTWMREPNGRVSELFNPGQPEAWNMLMTLRKGLRATDAAIVERWPTWERYSPSQWLDKAEMGTRVRKLTQVLGIADARLLDAVKQEHLKTFDKLTRWGKEFEVPRERWPELVKMSEHPTPGWWDALADGERNWMRQVQSLVRSQSYVGAKLHPDWFFEIGGEFYSRFDSPALWRRHKAVRATAHKLAKLKAEPVGKRGARTLTEIERLERGLGQQIRTRNKLAERRPPARWKPLLSDEFNRRLREIATVPTMAPETWEALLDDLINGKSFLAIPGVDNATLRKLANETAKTWQDMKAALPEQDHPHWYHHPTERGLRQLMYPRVVPQVQRVAPQAMPRSLSVAPWDSNVGVSITLQAKEWLDDVHRRHAVDELRTTGLIRNRDELLAQASQMAIARGMDVGPAMARIHQEWPKFDPKSFFPFGAKVPPGMFGPELVIHKSVAGALKRIGEGPKEFARGAEKVMNVFRNSVLRFSPSFYVNQVIGDNLALAARDPTAHRWSAEAWRQLQAGEIPAEVLGGIKELSPDAIWDIRQGKQVAKWVEQGAIPGSATGAWKYSQLINDMARATAYLSGKAKAQRGGLVGEAAVRAGLEHVNKIFQNWGTMTPIERTFVRSFIPFYSFARYIMRYVGSYPFDHPVRAAIMSNFIATEWDDFREQGTPQQLMRLWLMGKPDPEGNQLGISLAGPIPFHDVANWFTMAGFFSHFNPLITAGLEAVGVDPFNLSADLFPELRYDPVSGRMVATRPPAARTLLSNLVPQAGAIWDVVAPTEQITQMRETNPGAWLRRVLGRGFGIRFVPTTYNIAQERGKAEAQRLEAFRAALNAAEVGDVRGARGYPAFERLAQVIQEQYGL